MRNAISLLSIVMVSVVSGLGQARVVEREPLAGYTLPDDPAAAWAEVEKVHQALQPPLAWRTHPPQAEEIARFQREVRERAILFANKAEEFIKRFPTNENIGDARITVVHALNHAVAAGDTNAETRIKEFVAAVLADKSIPEDDRVVVLMFSGNTAFFKKVGMRLFTEGMHKLNAEFESNEVASMRSALKQFPTNSLLYTMMLVSIAQRSAPERQRELATEVINAPGAAPGARTLAEHLLKGTKPYEVGKPVVLVEFWSTSCGPCVAEMPTVKAAYQKLHDRGFDVVGISLDDKESVLRRFLKEKDLPWPQYFDGKGWENKFAVRYGIFAIPTMWLVDTAGNLCRTEARLDLERQVASMLDANSAVGK